MDQPGTPPWRDAEAARLISFGRGSALPAGGFGWLNATGGVDPSQPRPLYVTSRMTYSFALAGMDGYPHTTELATSGLRSLAADYADPEHDGWFASLSFDGRVVDSSKMNYAHALTLLAASSAVVAELPGAAETYDRAATTIERRFWSDREGCAVETWNADFTDLEPYRGANSNMHSVEAYLAAADASGDGVWRERGLSIATRIIDGHAREHGWRIPEHYDESWNPILDFNTDHRDDQFRPFGATPGHSFEWSRLLLQLEAALPHPPSWLAPAAQSLFDTAVGDGTARDGEPGLVYTVDMDGEPVVTARLHWVICEAVLAADALYRRTGAARYLDTQNGWWDQIERYFVDRADGSWHHELGADMTPATGTWSGKPDVYHTYQALLFPSLPLAPTAATALRRGLKSPSTAPANDTASPANADPGSA